MIKLRTLYQESIQAAEEKGIQEGIQTGIQAGIQTGIQEGIQTGIQEGIKQGIETGVQSERRATLETIFSARFGGVDPELMAVIDQVIILSSDDYSQLLPQLFSISREDLLKQLENLGG
jgi:flagellar biosynthesis/type III secretory pathway protein FliH